MGACKTSTEWRKFEGVWRRYDSTNRNWAAWNPLTEPRDRDELVEAMAKKRIYIDLKPYPDLLTRDGSIKYEVWIDMDDPINPHPTPGTAVCIAAAKALIQVKCQDDFF